METVFIAIEIKTNNHNAIVYQSREGLQKAYPQTKAGHISRRLKADGCVSFTRGDTAVTIKPALLAA